MLGQIITYEDDFMKAKIYIALNSEIRINTQFKNTLTNYTKSIIKTKNLVLLLVDWDKNSLLFRKRLHMMKKIIGCFRREQIRKLFSFVSHAKHMFVYEF